MPTRPKTPPLTTCTTRSGQNIRPTTNFDPAPLLLPTKTDANRVSVNVAVQPPTDVRKPKRGSTRRKVANEEAFVLESSSDDKQEDEDKLVIGSEEEENKCLLKEATKPWESGL